MLYNNRNKMENLMVIKMQYLGFVADSYIFISSLF